MANDNRVKAGIPGSHKPRLLVKFDELDFSGALEPLKQHRGVYFPYTPNITTGFGANYGTYDTTHSVYQQHYYVNTPNPTISIQATFAANTVKEAQYSAAALHFFKTMTKMDFGKNAKRPGLPPPLLTFSAYGDMNFLNVPVVLTSYDMTLSEEHNYVTTTIGNSEVSLPTSFVVSLTLGVQQTPSEVTKNFSFNDYANGSLIKGGFI